MLNILLVENNINPTQLDIALKKDDWFIRKIRLSPLFLTHVREFNPDLVIFDLNTPSESLIADLYRLDQSVPVPIIIFAQQSSEETTDKIINAEVSAYIVDGLSPQRLGSIIHIALARFKQRQAQRQALEDARTQLEDRKQIDRAKAILIKAQKFTEDAAYHTLRKLAMDRNITLGEMARNVIAMAELLK